ncbi:conserved Plasmodium protein, unknown function [Plasmodium relictum]|uniref:Uncharacterized protein n=1 Tax=Plasmodium relictum TaxID=85471 RepID=A0A1J1H9Q5_PLARL|nr:conserved Plasmodium protein, unknown function [Plasmodium relictum]CRH00168.1 conserved Plasmodium protein, unknown function [Plasmodium relictum]
MSNNLNCINYDFNQKVKWNFYINLRDVTDLKELDELLSEEENCYRMNNENKMKSVNNICEKNLLGEIIKAYIFCKSVKIKETCNLCLMSWISTKQCWFDCDELLLNKYFEGLLEPLIFICKVLKEKVIHHFYQIPKELYVVFINKFKKYLRIYKDKEIILSIISSAWDILHSKIYSQN